MKSKVEKQTSVEFVFGFWVLWLFGQDCWWFLKSDWLICWEQNVQSLVCILSEFGILLSV